MRLPILSALLVTSAGSIPPAAADEPAAGTPFVVRDQNPLLAGFGLPTTLPSRIADEFSGGLDLYWGSTAIMQSHGDEALLVDAETREARAILEGKLTDRVGWRLQVPYRYTGGGTLDSFIDSWHNTFGLPDGARSALPDDQIAIAYTRTGTRQLDITSSSSGLGDLQAALGYELHSAASSTLTAWLDIKLPTGDADKLTGSGATDVSLVLAGRHSPLNSRWTMFGQAGVTYLGEGDLLPDQQRSVVWSGMAGVSVRTWRGLSFKAQFDAHTAAYDSDLDFFSDAVVLTVGGDYLFESGWRLDLGVSEDIAVEHSPDVVFVLGVHQDG
ncbi:DUF3187 family protein [Peristeroidobacter soli]|uniref:DUF3187 family protein n=1 Tax=Peristeroidobacter soli TaxID=2497877 RepID=UPI00101BEB13|nr:DUF3187 family protein [Peristeroidobacter soli]